MTEEKKQEGVQMMEIKGIIQMLKATARTAEHWRMTQEGENLSSKAGIRQYNAIVKRIGNFVSEGLFAPLEEDDSILDLGMACEQMAAYLEGMMEEAGPQKNVTSVNAPHFNIMGLPTEKLKMLMDMPMEKMERLGELIRHSMPAWIKKHEEEKNPDMNDLESRMAELGAQMQVLAERMHREELSGDEIHKLADQMRQLGQQLRTTAIRTGKATCSYPGAEKN